MLEACPCFRNRQTTKQHERTIAGTKAHAVADSRIDDPTLGDDDAENVATCLDLAKRRKDLMEESRARAVKELSDELEGNHTYKSGAIQEAEELIDQVSEQKEFYWPIDDKIFIDFSGPEVDGIKIPINVKHTTAGYADVVLVSHDRKRAEVLDWKYGKWPVTDAKKNLQGIAYALGVFRAYPTVDEIQVWFVQPMLDLTTEATFKRSEIPALYLRVQVVVARAREARQRGDFSTATPKVPICNFCDMIGLCPKVAAFSCEVGKKFFPLEIPDNITPTMIHDPHNTSLGMRLASVVKVWAEAFRAQVTDRVLARRADMPEGFKIESKSNREIVDMEKLKKIALTYLTQAEYETTLSTTFGALEELISDKAPRGSKKAALEDFKKKLEEEVAVKRSDPYSFLKAIPAIKKNK